MKKIEKIRYGYFSPTGYEILENGCIEFTHFIGSAQPPDYQGLDIAAIVQAVIKNENETGNEYNREHYIESINSWLQKLEKIKLCIPLVYNVETFTAHNISYECKCGIKWSEKKWVSDSPETEKWGCGEIAKVENFIKEHVNNEKIHEIIKIDTCDTCILNEKITALYKKIPELADETGNRDVRAVEFFEEHPEYNPTDYTVTRRSSGFNPTAFSRKGCIIGYTNGPAGYNKYTCYLVRK